MKNKYHISAFKPDYDELGPYEKESNYLFDREGVDKANKLIAELLKSGYWVINVWPPSHETVSLE